MSLSSRQSRFAEMSSRFPHTSLDPLIVSSPIRPDLFKNLQAAVIIYMSRCLPERTIIQDEAELLAAFIARRKEVKNCTPNGMLVPKRHLILEYNMVIRAYMDVINALNIGDFISSWHIPLNVRYKDGDVVKENMTRHHPTEHIHSDSWAGESAQSLTTMIPLLGDVERNRVDYYAPPPDFEESWLGPLPSYKDGAKFAAKYKKVEVPFAKGFVNITDFATLHSSTRYPGSGPRVSIDTSIAMPSKNEKEVIHSWRVEERMSNADLGEIGRTKLFVFSHGDDEHVDSQGGFKHPTSLRVVDLF